MSCRICETRRPKRYCPGVRGEICSLCCGAEREVTVDCPFECEYLQDARKREKPARAEADRFPNQDIRVTEQFLQDHQPLVVFLGRALLNAALQTPWATDFEVREALEALVRTYRTLGTGLIYETRPDSPVAGRISRMAGEALAEYRKKETERLGMTRTRDADVLGVLVFLQRLELDRNNGRKRGRAYIDFLLGQVAPEVVEQPTSGSLLA
ncbi:MAG: hypothetical protein HYR60_23215 [Acidobacteria bacterium]|nr:hypothetical protein [Acidobacteriota bacterium]